MNGAGITRFRCAILRAIRGKRGIKNRATNKATIRQHEAAPFRLIRAGCADLSAEPGTAQAGASAGRAVGTILLTPNEPRVAEDRRHCHWLYVATDCANKPVLQEPVKDPARFPWHEVTKVAHYWLEVNAMTQPTQVREEQPRYGSVWN